MKEYVFRGGTEVVKLRIERETKRLEVASSLTGDKFVPRPWSYLFDKGKERVQEIITDKCNDIQFEKVLKFAFQKLGYELISKNDKL
jgi:predicted ATPase